jgi:polyhydroxyalkanoate synthase
MTNMKEKSANGTKIVNSWARLVDNTAAGYDADTIVEGLAEAQHRRREDPWVTLIDRLWDAHPLSEVVPIDLGEILEVFQGVWLDALSNPTRLPGLYSDFVMQSMQLMANTTLKLWGLGRESKPIIEPAADDRRFSFPEWQQTPTFDALKQFYLLTSTTLLKAAEGIETLDNKQQRKLTFLLRQFIDAISPTNFAFTNPEVIHETIKTGGQNLVKGMQHLLRDIQEGEIQITDTKAFQVGKDLAITPGQVIYRNSLIELIQYTPTTEQVHAIPILHIPPWVNKYYILDLQPQNSMVKFLLDQGFTVFVISWKNPDVSMADVSYEDYVTLGPLAALEAIKDITGSPKVNTAAYCIAGQLQATVLPYLAAKGDETVNAATFVVTLADMQAEINDVLALIDETTLRFAERQIGARGVLGSREMATMFRMLRANDLIWSSVINNYYLGKESPAFDVLFWNNDGTRMTDKAHTYYMRKVCVENGLVKPGHLVIKGVPIDTRTIRPGRLCRWDGTGSPGALEGRLAHDAASRRLSPLRPGRQRPCGWCAGTTQKGQRLLDQRQASEKCECVVRGRAAASRRLVGRLGRVVKVALGGVGRAPTNGQPGLPADCPSSRNVRNGEVTAHLLCLPALKRGSTQIRGLKKSRGKFHCR